MQAWQPAGIAIICQGRASYARLIISPGAASKALICGEISLLLLQSVYICCICQEDLGSVYCLPFLFSSEVCLSPINLTRYINHLVFVCVRHASWETVLNLFQAWKFGVHIRGFSVRSDRWGLLEESIFVGSKPLRKGCL